MREDRTQSDVQFLSTVGAVRSRTGAVARPGAVAGVSFLRLVRGERLLHGAFCRQLIGLHRVDRLEI